MLRAPLISTLFPYTTLFRSHSSLRERNSLRRKVGDAGQWTGAPISDYSAAARNCRRNVEARSFGGADCTRRSEEHTSELQSLTNLVCRLLLEKKNKKKTRSL